MLEAPADRERHHEWHNGYRMGHGPAVPRDGITPQYTGTIYAGPQTHRPTDPERRTAPRPVARTRMADTSAWHWLLLVPVVLPLLTPLYNRIEPTLFGFPFFYWFQLALAGLSSLVIALVNLATRKRV